MIVLLVWLWRISGGYSTHPRPRRYCFRIWSKTTPQRLPVVTEVFEIHVVPASDVWIVPSLLTLTSNPLEVVVEVLSLFAHEMIVKQKQKIRKTCKICFIFFPISKVKYYCLCIRRSQYIPRFRGVLQESGILLGGCLTVKN